MKIRPGQIRTHKEVLMAFKKAGMDSLPGAGAEILTDRACRLISKEKNVALRNSWTYCMWHTNLTVQHLQR